MFHASCFMFPLAADMEHTYPLKPKKRALRKNACNSRQNESSTADSCDHLNTPALTLTLILPAKKKMKQNKKKKLK